MKKRMMAILMTLGLCLSACGDSGNQAPENLTPTPAEQPEAPTETVEQLPYVASENVKKLGEGLQTLAAPEGNYNEEELSGLSGLYGQLFAHTVMSKGEHPNVLISPTSLILAMGMCENGAAGDTLSQMEEVMGGVDVAKLNVILNGMSERLQNSDQVDWDVANSIWFKDDGKVKIKDEFVQKAQSWYDAELWMAPFDGGTLDDINGWVSDRTKGMIPKILDSIPDNARSYLINALAFEGDWMEQYDDSDVLEGQNFTNADGSKKQVTMLYSNEEYYFNVAGGTGFLKDYKGGEYSFMGLLPEEGTDMDAFVAELGTEDLAGILRHPKYGEVIVKIPEFSTDTDLEMGDIFKGLGMELAFDEYNADFSNMVDIQSPDIERIYIGRVIHKTHIEVDRKGTKAAAASAVEMLDRAAAVPDEDQPVVIYLTRPFVYGIIDNATGLPVFIGVMNTME